MVLFETAAARPPHHEVLSNNSDLILRRRRPSRSRLEGWRRAPGFLPSFETPTCGGLLRMRPVFVEPPSAQRRWRLEGSATLLAAAVAVPRLIGLPALLLPTHAVLGAVFENSASRAFKILEKE